MIDTDAVATLREWFAVPPSAARLVARLYAAGGKVVEHHDCRRAAGQTTNGINLSVKLLRAAMEPGAIANEHCVGYRLTPTGIADCDRAMADAATRERAA